MNACGADKDAAKQTKALAALEASANSDPEFADPLGRQLVDLVRDEALGWVKDGPLLRGKLDERAKQSFLVVLKYGRCYRFLGVGGPGVVDLDLMLYDAQGSEVLRDVTQSPTPVLGTSASLCPGEASALRVEARMRHGRGDFAIGVFHDPE
jgi:hypothetical protein